VKTAAMIGKPGDAPKSSVGVTKTPKQNAIKAGKLLAACARAR